MLYKRSLAIMTKSLGPNHSNVVTILCNLASLYREQGRYAEATGTEARAAAIRAKCT